jgi:hypothetical protein
VSFKVRMYSTVNNFFHISIRFNCNRISEDLVETPQMFRA